MDGAGKAAYRVGDRVNDVVPKGFGIPGRERFCSRGFELSTFARQPAPEDVVLTA
jgi:hypothetical protein